MKRLYLVLLVLVHIRAVHLKDASETTELFPDVTLYNQMLSNKESCYYHLNDVLLDTTYEVRISYPAVIPTDFLIEIQHSNAKKTSSRKLLNVEQLWFVAAPKKHYTVKVTAYRTGVPLDEQRLNDPVRYNIIFNRLYLGCSVATWKLIVVLIALTILIVVYGAPFILWYIEKECHQITSHED